MWCTKIKNLIDGNAYFEYRANLRSPLKDDLSMFSNFVLSFCSIMTNFALGELSSVTMEPRNFNGFTSTELINIFFLLFHL